MKTKDILSAIGRQNVASRLGVGLAAVSVASVNNQFSASWFPALKELAAEKGINVESAEFEALFNWKLSKPSKPDGRDAA